jgi:hypothetical protein
MRRYITESSPFYARAFMADLTTKIAWIARTDFTGSPRDNTYA